MRNERQIKQLTESIYTWIQRYQPDTLPPFMGSISNIYLSKGNHFARIKFVIHQHEDQWLQFFTISSKIIQKHVAKNLNWRKTPTLSFVLDDEQSNINQLKEILEIDN